jgi:glyoxylase-like metal-dependent hydrolase (beta-lactamase superfamily II)
VTEKRERHPANAAGDWYVDTACIDCGASRDVAPGLIVEADGQSVFARQPASAGEDEAAWRAALVCPTASVRTLSRRKAPPDLYPHELAPSVFRCGYNAASSYGAHAYFCVTDGGNFLVDSPRYLRLLVDFFARRGGLSAILLTHRDDVADADRYAARFGSRVFIHEDDRGAAPYATDLLRGEAAVAPLPDVTAIPTPGHTRGSVCYLLDDTYLFTGDSLCWSHEDGDLHAFRDYCWYSWSAQKRSLSRLAKHRFEWVLAGHGASRRLPADEMRARLEALVSRM